MQAESVSNTTHVPLLSNAVLLNENPAGGDDVGEIIFFTVTLPIFEVHVNVPCAENTGLLSLVANPLITQMTTPLLLLNESMAVSSVKETVLVSELHAGAERNWS